MELTKTSKIAGILLAYPIAFAYLKYFLLDLSDTNITIKKIIFTAFFILLNELIVRGRGKTPSKETYFWYGIMGIVALTFETGLNPVVSFIGLHLCAFYVAIVSNGLCFEGRTGSFVLADLFNAQIYKGFGGMSLIFDDMKKLKSEKAPAADKKSKGSTIGAVIIVLVLLPFFCVAVGLLTEINPDFNDAVVSIIDKINVPYFIRWFFRNFGYIVFAIPTSMYLYSLLGNSADSTGEFERKSYEKLVKWRESCRRISPVVTAVVTGLFVLLYFIFFVFEGSYLFSAFVGKLPSAYTASEYARRGFFELTGIMAINMMIFLLISYFENRKLLGRKLSCIMTSALMSESVVFAMISFSKLALYYARFGYTPKRLLAMWGSLIFAAGAVMVIVSTIKRKDMSRVWIYFTTVSFAAMSILSSVLSFFAG